MIPPFSPTFIKPSHKVITPVRPREISKPVLALSKVLPTRAANISVSWKNSSLNKAMAKATRKKAIQMKFKAMKAKEGS
jgi:hypothetical protein